MIAGREGHLPANVDVKEPNIIKVNHNNDGLFVKAQLFDTSLHCLLDTGASTCVLNPPNFLKVT